MSTRADFDVGRGVAHLPEGGQVRGDARRRPGLPSAASSTLAGAIADFLAYAGPTQSSERSGSWLPLTSEALFAEAEAYTLPRAFVVRPSPAAGRGYEIANGIYRRESER